MQFMVGMAPRDVRWKAGPGGTELEATFKIRIANSIVNVEVDVNQCEKSDVNELFRQAYDLTRASVNLVAFATGTGPIVVFDTLIDANGIPTVLAPQEPSLSNLCTAFQFSDEAQFSQIYNMVLTDPSLFRALNDLIECVWNPHVSCVNCGRVIDSIRRMITPTDTRSDVKAWEAMHSALNISQGYQKWVSNTATGPRHGDPAFVSGNITIEVAGRTWTIMNRFLEYRKRANVPLTAPEFPLLI
jgi:hypothetical protein